MRVGFVTADWSSPASLGGSGFHRIGQPAAALAAFGGVEVVISDGFSLSRTEGIKPHAVPGDLDSGVDGCDVIVFQRCMQEYIPRATEAAQMCGQIVIQDVDDWFWGLATTNHAFDAAHPKNNPDSNINHYRKSLAMADVITVSTRYLATRLAKLGRPIALLPNMIDVSRYTPNDVTEVSEGLAVGWTGGIPWRSGDLEQLAGILGPWLVEHGCGFIHGGKAADQQHSAADLLNLPHETNRRWRGGPTVPVVERPLCTPDEYPALFAGMDIFVAPLSDRPFNLAKSNCKLLEAAAAGVPYVASHVGPYAEWDGAGRTAKKPRDWRRHLDALLDPDVRRAQRQAQLDAVATQDVTRRWLDWLLVYEHCAKYRTERLVRTMRDLDLLEKELTRRGVLTDAES
jgi:hypothetical protein